MIDMIKLSIKAGNGGNGCISFRREKFVPRGGPDGGDGGNGGSVFIVGDPSLNTLLHLKYHSTWRGKRGAHGGGNQRRGANGVDLRISVPLGTEIWRLTLDGGKELVVDVDGEEEVLVARGGAGGLGNKRYVSAVNREPLLAEKGENGQVITILLELKLLADVGLIGLPNVGKSTLLSCCTAAKPKIAAYPFTTTDPVLGVVTTRDHQFVMMEVPGLIEGAHEGAGLGHEFLRHAERARVLLHLLDGSADDPLGDWHHTNFELSSFRPALGEKPQLIVVNKLDIWEVRERVPALKGELELQGVPVFFVSAGTGEGIEQLLGKTLELVQNLPKEHLTATPMEVPIVVPKEARPFSVTQENGTYVVRAPRVERMLPLADLKNWRVMVQLWKELDRLGVVKALEDKGVQPGDTVRLGRMELEWY